MQLPSDTPPDGDFARYVEKLSAAAAAIALAKQAAADAQAGRSRAPAVVSPARQAEEKTLTPSRPVGPWLWTMGKWMLMAWVALQLVNVLVPRASMLSLPLLMAFAAWAIYRFKKSAPELLTGRLRELAEQAARQFKQG